MKKKKISITSGLDLFDYVPIFLAMALSETPLPSLNSIVIPNKTTDLIDINFVDIENTQRYHQTYTILNEDNSQSFNITYRFSHSNVANHSATRDELKKEVKINEISLSINEKGKYFTFSMTKVFNGKKSNFNDLIRPVAVYKRNRDKIHFLISLIEKATGLKKDGISLLELQALEPCFQFIDKDLPMTPSEEAKMRILDTINLYEKAIISSKQRSIQHIKSGPFSIIGLVADQLISLRLGSIEVYGEVGSEKFRFFDHEGLKLFAYLAEKTDWLDKLTTLASERLVDFF